MPGNCLLPLVENASDVASPWFRLKAADPAPRSAVCLNQVGSFEPKDCAISFLEKSSASSRFSCSGAAAGATSDGREKFGRGRDEVDSLDDGRATSEGREKFGRGRDEFESLDDGRCCHERVPERESIVAVVGPDRVGLGGL